MDNRIRLVTFAIVVLIALSILFTFGGAALTSQDDIVNYLPVILKYRGTPVPTATATPTKPAASPTPTFTPTPSPTPIPRHFDDCAFRTGNNATIAVPANVTINGGLVLAVDDEIAVFTPDGLICAGMTPWDGKNIAITAWGDDSQTPTVDGLREGELMAFRIWDDSAGQELVVSQAAYSIGDGLYAVDGIFVVSAFTLE